MTTINRRTMLAFAGFTGMAFTAACAPSTGGNDTAGGDEGSGDGTVTMVLWPGPEGDAMTKVVDAYNAGQGKGDGIKVETTLLSRQDTFSKESTLMATKSSDQDIYFVASYNVGQFANALDPLTDVDASNYFPVAVEGLQYEDKQYALPLDVSNHFLLYRKDLLDALLADPAAVATYQGMATAVLGTARDPKPAEEWDWDDYKVAAAYFTKSNNAGSPTEYGTILPAKNLLYNTMIWDDTLWGMGGGWTDDAGKANLDTDQGKAAVQLWSDIYSNGWCSKDSAQAEYPETQAALKSGNTAFAVQWSSGFAELADAEKSPAVAGKIAIAPVPGQKTHVHALAVALNKYSENKAAAKTFLAHLATVEAMTSYAQAGGIPAMPQVLQDNADLNAAFPDIATSIDDYGYSVPVFPNTFKAYSTLAEKLSSAWVAQTDVASAVESANTELEKLLP